AYIFERTDAGWVSPAKPFASGASAGEEFGLSVAMWGDTIVVGAPSPDPKNPCDASAPGKAYVFERGDAGWSQGGIPVMEAQARDEFGASVAVWGDTIVVGARCDVTDAGAYAGAVYVFERGDAGWTQQKKILGDENDTGFGRAVAVWKNTIVVGAPW